MLIFKLYSSRTALAEAELEYNEEHVSKSVYIKFPMAQCSSDIKNIAGVCLCLHVYVRAIRYQQKQKNKKLLADNFIFNGDLWSHGLLWLAHCKGQFVLTDYDDC